ncbi:MAG: DUF4157 domain-containing protein [Caldilineaceae bacterium]
MNIGDSQLIQRQAASVNAGVGPSDVQQQNQTGLPENLKVGIEQLSGLALDDVRVHYHSPRPAQLQALAYTQGAEIYVGPGQERHLPHEAWHVVQQKQGRVQPTLQTKKMSINYDATLEREADMMGAKALQMTRRDQAATRLTTQPSTSFQQTEADLSPSPRFLKTAITGEANNAPIQGRFGFEIEVPILFLHKQNFPNVPARGHGGVGPMPLANRINVPCDAALRAGATNVHDAHPGADCRVNVDHNGALDPLYKRELEEYAVANGLTVAETQGLLLYTGATMPHQASILEVVTDPWDENTLTRPQAQQKFMDVTNWVQGLFNQIQGNQQVPLGHYFIGSTSPDADRFQPRLGYFHSTYGVKLSQVPRLLERTTNQKNILRNYATTHASEQEHADNVRRTFRSIGKARTALTAIKGVWPRHGAGWFTGGALKTKGSKGWNPGTEEAFLGFLTLVDNYLLMFQSNSTSNLGKQKVGMHYYKSDLYDLAQQLPAELINTLTGNPGLRTQVIAAIGASVGLAANTPLTGPMAGWTLTQYLQQIFTGVHGVRGHDTNMATIYDPLLAGSINPWSAKLGPEHIGPMGNQALGVVMENRHLEYMDPNYGANATMAATQMAQEYAQNAPGVPGRNIATFESIKAREAGPARRPINEWVNMMLGIYDMLVAINQ